MHIYIYTHTCVRLIANSIKLTARNIDIQLFDQHMKRYAAGLATEILSSFLPLLALTIAVINNYSTLSLYISISTSLSLSLSIHI